MAAERHTTALVVGLVLGGLAGAAVTLWKTPRSGAQLRALVAERAEEVLFRLTGMNETQMQGAPGGTPAASYDGASAAAVTAPLPALAPEPTEGESAVPAEDDDGATLPATFRGEVLTEQPTDIVLDGPRPAPADR